MSKRKSKQSKERRKWDKKHDQQETVYDIVDENGKILNEHHITKFSVAVDNARRLKGKVVPKKRKFKDPPKIDIDI